MNHLRPITRMFQRIVVVIAIACLGTTLALAQTATDACSYAGGAQYTVNSSCTFQTFSKPGSFGADINPSGCSGSNNDDAFGWFTATSTTTVITYDPDNNGHDPIMHLFSGTCGSLSNLTCANNAGDGGNETITYTTTIGTNYLVRIQRNGTNNGMDGRLCIWSPTPPSNDDPCSATSLTVNTTCSSTAGTNVAATATSGIPAPGCGSYTGGDVWYTFVAPSNGIVNIETSANSLTNSDIALYSATACGGTFTLIECDDLDGPGNMGGIYRTGLTAGQTYYVRVWGNAGTSGTFNICAVSLANDDPCGAVALTVGSSCTNTATTNLYATSSTGIPAPGCGNYTTGDVWYTFVAPASGKTTVTTSANGLTDSGVAIYTATACSGTFTLVSCSGNGNGNMGSIASTGLTAGQTYYVRAWGESGAQGTFNICAFEPIANDDPCSAIALTVGTTCTSTAATNVGATATSGPPAPGCANYTGGDVWFSFVAPANGRVSIETTASGMTDSGMALYSATACGGTFTLIECDDDDGPGNMSLIQRTGLTAGTTYYVRMWGYNGTTGGFNICVTDFTLPANDDPCGAVTLTLGTSCSYTAYSNVYATSTASIPAAGCGSYSGGDVWFKFVAPSTGLVTLRTTAGTLTNADMALYSATACNGTFNLILCDATSGVGNMPFLSFTPLELVAGQTYYLRVWGDNSSTGTFNLCAETPATSSSCVYVLRMYDSMGDGWSGSNVSIQVGSGAAVSYTIANQDQETAYILVNTGDVVQLSYNSVGGGQSEIRYVLQLMYGMLYGDGPSPTAGLRYAGSANCQSPNPLNSDCYGNTAICNSQQINANPNNTGLTADINVNTRGCLGSNERQGYWYSFKPSAGGTVAFTITPSNSGDDYDFAVWGPYTSLSCPPLVTPARCNYSGSTGNTGLSTTASNASEGSGGSKWSTAITVTSGEYYLLYISNYSQSGLAFDLTWQLTNGASLDCTLLPVELLSFDGQAEERTVLLDWITASETNSAYFDVERSVDGVNYTHIGTVAAAGTTSTTTHYDLVDEQPAPGVNYYRLKQVDLDGNSTTSEVKAVLFRNGISAGLPYPNPANDLVNVDVLLGEEADLWYSITDASGRIVRTERVHLSAGSQRLQAPLSGLDAGYYAISVTLSTGEALQAGRFMVN